LHILVFRREEKLTGAFWAIGRVNHVNVRIIGLSSAMLEQDGHAYCAPRRKALCALPVFTARKNGCHFGHPCLRAVLVTRAVPGVLQVGNNYYVVISTDRVHRCPNDTRINGREHG